MYTLEGFIKGKFIVNCQEHKESVNLFYHLKKLGVMWVTGEELDAGNIPNEYETRLCYYVTELGLTYSEREYYLYNVDREIILFHDLDMDI